MVRRISGSGLELDQNKVQLRAPSALQGRIYYYLWCKCFSCLIRIDSVRFSCFCYVNNNQQNLIFSREIILVFSPSPSLRLPQISSGPMANPSVHNTIYQYPSTQPQMITYQKKVPLKRSDISIIPQRLKSSFYLEGSNLGISGCSASDFLAFQTAQRTFSLISLKGGHKPGEL